MLRALDYKECRRDSCYAVADDHNEEQYFSELLTKALLTMCSSDFSRKDGERQTMTSLRLALEANFPVWVM